jgi:hypothetical protein
MSSTINYNYSNTLTTKVDSDSYTFRGKTNAPNLNIVSGSHAQSYVSSNLIIRDGKMLIEHIPNTNSDGKVSVIFTLYTDLDSKPNEIDKLIALKPGDKLEVDLNNILRTISQEHTIQTDKSGRVISISYDEPITIRTKVKAIGPVVEGLSCGDQNFDSKFKGMQDQLGTLASQMATAMAHITNEGQYRHDGAGKTGSGSASGADIMKDMDCTAFPTGNATDEQVKLVSVPISANLSESQANSKLMVIFLAYGIMFTILFSSLFFVVPLTYSFILSWLAGGTLVDTELLPLVRMRHIEGLLSFIFIMSSIMSYRFGGDAGVTAGGWLMAIWLMSAIIIGARKDILITNMPGGTEALMYKFYGEVNASDPKSSKPGKYGTPPNSGIWAILYYVFIFLPAYPLAWIGENINSYIKRNETGFGGTDISVVTPPPYRLWNTYKLS